MYGNYGGNYGNYRGYNDGSYNGNYNDGNYGRRGRDSRGRYMGYDDEKENLLNDMHEFYHKYSEGRRGGYNGDSTKSLRYMLESAKDFMRKLAQDAGSQEEMEMVRRTVQEIQNEMM